MKFLKGIDKNYVELEVELLAETPAALKISDGTMEVWVPKSQLESEVEQLDNGLIQIVIPEWLAREKGLI